MQHALVMAIALEALAPATWAGREPTAVKVRTAVHNT